MNTTRLLSAIAALSIGGIAASTSANAEPAFGLNVMPTAYYQQYSRPPQCWRWSHRHHHWIWICPPVQQYQVYPYYEEPAPFFGFSFGFGGDFDHRQRHER